MIVIRADATPVIGAGHSMRCLALALAARKEAKVVRIVGRITIPWVLERLGREDVDVALLPGDVPSREHPDDLLAQIGDDGDWVVLDGYHFGPDCHHAVREIGRKLLVIDDYAHLPEYECDILLNQNIGAERLAYRGAIGKKLMGPRFTLMRPEFVEARKRVGQRKFTTKAQKILLTLGGGDSSQYFEGLAPNLTASELDGCLLRVVAGVTPEKRIRHCLRNCSATIEVIQQVNNMPELFLDTDLCVSAGGSTCWELCCLGVPFLTVETAENQSEIVRCLAEYGIAQRFTKERFAGLIGDRNGRRAMGESISKYIDGLGTFRVMDSIKEYE